MSDTPNPPHAPIHVKVKAAGIAGAIVTLLVWVLNSYVLPDGDVVPGDAAAAMVVVVSFLTSYMVSARGEP